MLLALDVGNTNIVVGVFDGNALAADWRVRTDRDRTADELGLLLTHLLQHRRIDPERIDAVALCNVVPTMSAALLGAARRYFNTEPMVVGPDTDFGIGVHYEPVRDVGPDRLANAVAVRARYGAPAIVVDFGTSTNFDVISREGDFVGGVIAPGVGVSSDALFRAASRLYRVELVAPARAVGTSTLEAMQSGIVFGFAGQVDAIVRRVKREVGADARVVATGGLAELIKGQSETIDVVDQLLTLEGLRMLWERSRTLPSALPPGD